jgi:hypothetical protein
VEVRVVKDRVEIMAGVLSFGLTLIAIEALPIVPGLELETPSCVW